MFTKKPIFLAKLILGILLISFLVGISKSYAAVLTRIIYEGLMQQEKVMKLRRN